MTLVKVSSRLWLFSHCLTCFCKHSRWRHIRKLLIHSQRRRNQLHHQLGYFCLRLLRSMDSGVHFITISAPTTTISPASYFNMFWFKREGWILLQQPTSLFGHVSFYTSCRPCPGTPKLCPRQPFQASLGTVPEHGTVVFKQMNRTLGSSTLRSVPPVGKRP